MKGNDQSFLASRRNFIRQSACAALGYSGVVNALTQLSIVNSAVAQYDPGNYKALVVLFLAGGNDSNNMLIPRIGHPSYVPYKTSRGILTIYDGADSAKPAGAQTSLPVTTPDGNYGVHPNMPGVASLFNSGELALVANVGTLSYLLLTKEQMFTGQVPVPPQLFSHADQQLQWQSSVPDQPFKTGWGGRIADLLNSSTSGNLSMSVSLAGVTRLLSGLNVPLYNMDSGGTINLDGYGDGYYKAKKSDGTFYSATTEGRRFKAFEDVMRFTHANLLAEGYNQAVRRGRESESRVGAAITAANAAASAAGFNFTTQFAGSGALGAQLRMIAQMIAGRAHLGNSRQIFFASVSGYDTHNYQKLAHDNLMEELSMSLAAFSDAMIKLGVNDNVLTISQSDFGRTLTTNSADIGEAGSDHAWGGHQLVMGGGVTGGKVYGHFPSLIIRADNDIYGRGQFIPTTSVDQYLAVAAKWFGVTTGNMPLIFPNLGRFDNPWGATANLAYA